jgi:ABC-type uncharacterized transport system substrate-binding protein
MKFITHVSIRIPGLFIFYLAILLIGSVISPDFSRAESIVVLLSKDLPAYQQVVDGYTAKAPAAFKKIILADDAQKKSQLLSEFSSSGVKLVVTIGPEATNLLKTSATLPFLYTMVLEPQTVSGVRACGVLMRAGLESQMMWIHKLFPQAKIVSVIYNPTYTSKIVNRARVVAENFQLTLMPLAIEKSEEVTSALQKISEAKIDLLWSVVDPTFMQPQVIRETIAYTAAQKIPFIGLSEYHVKAGALAAMSVDYQDLGSQCADLSKKSLNEDCSGQVESPRRVLIYVNPAMQKNLGLQAWSNFPEVIPLNPD